MGGGKLVALDPEESDMQEVEVGREGLRGYLSTRGEHVPRFLTQRYDGLTTAARRRRRSTYGRIAAFRLPQVDRATAVDGSMRLNSMVSVSPSTKVVIDKVSPSML